MAFKISAYMKVSEEQKDLYNYSNCSKFSLTKDNIYYSSDSHHFQDVCFDVYENSIKKPHNINTLHAQSGSMFYLISIDLLNSSKTLIRSYDASGISEDNSSNYIFTIEKLKEIGFKDSDLTTSSTVYIRFKYSVCECVVYTQSEQKYFGYPKIIYGDSNNRTIIRDYIVLTDNTARFWICENKAGEYATQFKKWRIYLYRLTKDGNSYKSELVNNKGYDYEGPTHFISSVQFYRPEIDNTSSLVDVRNENLIKYDDLQKTEVYGLYEDEVDADNPCYFVVKAEYIAKRPRLVFWKRNGDGIEPKNYKYGEDLSINPLTGSDINMTKYGYTFDGYYVKSSGDSNDLPPASDTTLGDKETEYRKLVNSDGTFIKSVANFTGDDYEYINIIPEKYAFANWIPKETTIYLNWNIEHAESGSTIKIGGKAVTDDTISKLNTLTLSKYNEYGLSYSTTEKYNTTCENLIRDKGVKIPTITETVGNQTITWEFAGFYKEKGLSTKIVKEDGVFKRETPYTSAKKWDIDKSEVTLYAKWTKGAYYEVDKEGFEDAWGSCPDGYKAYYGSGSHATPKGNKQMDMNMPYLCYYENGDYVRDADGKPLIDHDMNFDGYYLYSADGTRGGHIVRRDGKFKLCTSCTDGARKNKKEGKVNLYAYWYGDKLKIKTGSNDTKMGTTSGDGRYKKSRDCTITASVKDSTKYCFIGWQKDGVSLDNGYISTGKSYTFKVEKAEKYIGYFDLKSYVINYKDVGGTNCTAENYIDINTTSFLKQDEYLPTFTSWWGITIPNAYKKGYTFKGWYKNSAGTIELDKDEDGKYIINEGVINDITLYAKWEKDISDFTVYLNLSKYINGNIPGRITVKNGDILTDIPTTYKPTVDGYSFGGYKDIYGKLVINKNCQWVKGTEYCDINGKCTITKALCENIDGSTNSITFYAYYIKDIDFSLNDVITRIPMSCNVEKIIGLDFQKYSEERVATINWINKAIGIPEIEYYDNKQQYFYTDDMDENYTSNKTLADKYFFHDFMYENNKCLTQGDIVNFFNNQATKTTSKVYIKSVERDENNKVFLKISFTNPVGNDLFGSNLFYITINDNKNIVYKFDFNLGTMAVTNLNLSYINVEIPDFFDEIYKITVHQIPSYVKELNGTRTYYRQNIVFNKFIDLDLTIEKNTILNNMEIKEYESDSLVITPIVPGGGFDII